jgi:hypothetical protein
MSTTDDFIDSPPTQQQPDYDNFHTPQDDASYGSFKYEALDHGNQ